MHDAQSLGMLFSPDPACKCHREFSISKAMPLRNRVLHQVSFEFKADLHLRRNMKVVSFQIESLVYIWTVHRLNTVCTMQSPVTTYYKKPFERGSFRPLNIDYLPRI